MSQVVWVGTPSLVFYARSGGQFVCADSRGFITQIPLNQRSSVTHFSQRILIWPSSSLNPVSEITGSALRALTTRRHDHQPDHDDAPRSQMGYDYAVSDLLSSDNDALRRLAIRSFLPVAPSLSCSRTYRERTAQAF